MNETYQNKEKTIWQYSKLRGHHISTKSTKPYFQLSFRRECDLTSLLFDIIIYYCIL